MQPGASGEDGGAGAVPLQGHKGPGQQLHNVKDSLNTYQFGPGNVNVDIFFYVNCSNYPTVLECPVRIDDSLRSGQFKGSKKSEKLGNT
jgi:hypothetical protein